MRHSDLYVSTVPYYIAKRRKEQRFLEGTYGTIQIENKKRGISYEIYYYLCIHTPREHPQSC